MHKSSVPPTPPPQNTTTITVVSNGARSTSSSSSSSLTDLGLDDCRHNSHSGVKVGSGAFISTVTVGNARRKEPPPVTPREKGNVPAWMKPSPASSVKSSPAPSVKSSPSASVRSSPAASVRSSPTLSIRSRSAGYINPSPSTPSFQLSVTKAASPPPPPKPTPPVLPRINGGDGVRSTVTVTTRGHSNNHAGANDVTESDFFSSLPSLPPDDYVAPSLSPTPSNVTYQPQPHQQSNPSSSSSTFETTTISTKILVHNKPIPPPPPPKSIPPPPPPPPPPKKPLPHLLNQRVPPSEHQRCPPPVSSKPVASHPPAVTGGAENGAYPEEDHEEDCGADGYPRERFYVNMRNGVSPDAGPGGVETTFAGRRDVRDPRSLHEKRIVSSKGTVRGFKNRVRAGIVTFVDPNSSKFNYREVEKGKIVVYTSSMTVIRETADRCKRCRHILQTHMVRFEQRDLYMNLDHQTRLRQRLDTNLDVPLPQVFIDGVHLGGADELEKLNESGELRKILDTFPKIQVRTMCDTCGGYRYVLCVMCHGSKKSVHRNNFTEEFFALRCMHCDENGLQRCQDCIDQQE